MNINCVDIEFTSYNFNCMHFSVKSILRLFNSSKNNNCAKFKCCQADLDTFNICPVVTYKQHSFKLHVFFSAHQIFFLPKLNY